MSFRFESMSAFWHMDGHGPYVWVAYAVTAAVLVYLALTPVLRRRRFLREHLRRQRLEERQTSDVGRRTSDAKHRFL